MNLVIDAGNTRTKIGIFEGATLTAAKVFDQPEEAHTFLRQQTAEHLIVCAVTADGDSLACCPAAWTTDETHSFSSVAHSESLRDSANTGSRSVGCCLRRLATVSRESSLVMDCGTCINYEFVHADGYYVGGGISPGVSMRFSAMHEMTDRLPLGDPTEAAKLSGRNTLECIQSGVMNGTLEEIKGIIRRYAENCPGIRVILTGGDAHFFEKPLKPSIFVAPELILTGLNSILLHNVHS